MNRRIQMFLGAAVVAVCVFSVGTEARAVAPKVLGTFTDGPYTWLLSVDSCAAAPEGYPLFVTLLENARPKGSVTLPMPAAVRDFAREPADQPWAVSALDAEPSLSAWGSGEEESYLGVVARLVPLGEKKQGLLVSEVGGFSHLHRAHALYAVVDGSLKELWSFDEGARPQASSVRPVVVGEKSFVLFQRDLWSHDEDAPDVREVFLLGLRKNAKEIEIVRLPAPEVPLYLVSAGLYDSSPSARSAAEGLRNCPDAPGLRVLASDAYPQTAKQGTFVLGDVFLFRDDALKYREKLRRCSPSSNIRLLVPTLSTR